MEDAQAKLERIKEQSRIRAARHYAKNKEQINLQKRGYEKPPLEEIPIIPFKGKKIKIVDDDGNALMDKEAIDVKGNISSSTRKNYESNLRNIQKYNEGRQIINTPNDHILKVIAAMSRGNNGTHLKLINIVYLVKSHFEMPTKDIEDERQKLFDESKEHTAKLLEKKNEILPELSVLVEFTKKLFDEGNYVSYIINFLLIKFGVRNKDLNVFITDDKKIVKANNSDNYLYVKSNSIDYIRNDYKTMTTYGNKTYNITDKKFIQAVKSLDNNTWILQRQDGGKMQENQFGSAVRDYTYNRLSETDYFKIQIKHALKTDSPKAYIEKLSLSRGTKPENIMAYYTLSNIDADDIDL